MKWIASMIMKIWGFKIQGPNPAVVPKYILVAAPHTSNWDFLIGILSKTILKMPINYLMKSSYFKPPLAYFFKLSGGVPVYRSKDTNMVVQLSETIRKSKKFSLCIAVEGTRSYTDKLKTGFYHIAKQAQIPLVMCHIDYGSKLITFSLLLISPVSVSSRLWI